MANSRVLNSKRNMFFGLIARLVALFMPFITRTVLIKELGANYLGLNSLFSSILTVLSVAELGFSNAIIYSMYKPIAEERYDDVNALLNLYRKVYRFIGLSILIVGLAITPTLKYLINGSVPVGVSIITLYFLYLGNTCISYFGFAYYKSLLSAVQREDLISRITTAITVIQNLIQVFLVFKFHNYYIYVIVIPCMTLLDNFLTMHITKKCFPQYRCEGNVPGDAKDTIHKNLKGVIIAKIGGVSRNAFDSIFISAYLGLQEVAIYNNYYYISSAVTGFMILIVTSITASVGNSIAINTPNENYNTMKKINFVYMWIAGWCTICLLCLYQPFMELWVGKEMTLPIVSMFLFCGYFYSLKLGDIQSVYMTAAGLFYEFRICAIIQAVANILLNAILGKIWGINGIILATMITIVGVDFLYGNKIVFRHYFKRSINEYFKSQLIYFITTSFIGSFVFFITAGNFPFIIKLIICCIIPNIFYILIYHKSNLYQSSMKWLISSFNINNKIIKRILLLSK